MAPEKEKGGGGGILSTQLRFFFNKIKFRNLTRDIWSAYSLFFLDNLIYKYWSGFPGCFFWENISTTIAYIQGSTYYFEYIKNSILLYLVTCKSRKNTVRQVIWSETPRTGDENTAQNLQTHRRAMVASSFS